jgi:leucyl aminopeptidase
MRDAAKIILLPSKAATVPLVILDKSAFATKLKAAPNRTKAQVKAQSFDAAALSFVAISNDFGETSEVWVGAPAADADPFSLGGLASKLPLGHYRFQGLKANGHLVALGWCLELYKYEPFRKAEARAITLECPANVDLMAVIEAANASFWVRDMINAPANLFGPRHLRRRSKLFAVKFWPKNFR